MDFKSAFEKTRRSLIKHYNGVTSVLTTINDYASEIAWATGTFVLLLAYPLALSITEDRVLTGRQK